MDCRPNKLTRDFSETKDDIGEIGPRLPAAGRDLTDLTECVYKKGG